MAGLLTEIAWEGFSNLDLYINLRGLWKCHFWFSGLGLRGLCPKFVRSHLMASMLLACRCKDFPSLSCLPLVIHQVMPMHNQIWKSVLQ